MYLQIKVNRKKKTTLTTLDPVWRCDPSPSF